MRNQWMAITSLIVAILGGLFIFLGGIGLLLSFLASILAIIFWLDFFSK